MAARLDPEGGASFILAARGVQIDECKAKPGDKGEGVAPADSCRQETLGRSVRVPYKADRRFADRIGS